MGVRDRQGVSTEHRQDGAVRTAMPGRRHRIPDIVFIKAGWGLFVVCAVCFCVVAWINRDWLSLAGSLAFLLANGLFMVPVYRRGGYSDD